MKIVVIGATGGSGKAAIGWLLEAGHDVTAFARRPEKLGISHERLKLVSGDVLSAEDVERAVRGHDAIVVTLGITENPIRVRLFGPARTPLDVRSRGTAQVMAAMRRCGVNRLVVQTSYGTGQTRDRLGWLDRLFFTVLLAPQIADTERQDSLVVESALDWTLVQPVHLTDAANHEMPFASSDGATRGRSLSRSSVGRFLAAVVTSKEWVGQSVALSGTA